MARPKKPIDVFALEKMAEKLWPVTEIAATLRVDPSTINRRYAKLIEECRQRGRAKLRDLQWARALAGSDRMLIHMSKHKLDEHERLEQTVTQTTSLTVTESPALAGILAKLRDDQW